MKQPDNATKATFEDLFSRLLSTVAEEQDIRSRGANLTRRVEVRDRLHSLRAHLAAARRRLATETAPQLHNQHRARYATRQQIVSPRRAA